MGRFGGIKIGQEEVINLLEKENRFMSSKEIAELLKEGQNKIIANLKKLLDNEEVSFKYAKVDTCKKPVRLYIIIKC